VLEALTQAASPEAVLVASESARPGDLPAPIQDLVERIRLEADRWERINAARLRAPRPRAKASDTRTQAPTSPAPDERLDRLVHRLVHLVHLAETDRRLSEARQRVRLAENAPAAIQEATPSAGPEATGSPSPEMGELGRQVLEAVIRILESRQQRRQEEPDVRDVQW
jgi:hypothetical protein